MQPAPQSQSSPHHPHRSAAQLMQCDARAGALLTLAPAFCPTGTGAATATAAAAVTSVRKLELASADYLTWDAAKELLT